MRCFYCSKKAIFVTVTEAPKYVCEEHAKYIIHNYEAIVNKMRDSKISEISANNFIGACNKCDSLILICDCSTLRGKICPTCSIPYEITKL